MSLNNILTINNDIELAITEYLKDELNKNSFGVTFDMGFWFNKDQSRGKNELYIKTEGKTLPEAKRVVPMVIEAFDGEILPIEGLFNVEYTVPLTFQININDKKLFMDTINAINEFKNKHRGKLKRFELPYIDKDGKEQVEMMTSAISTDNLTPVGDIDIQKGEQYSFGSLNIHFDFSKDISYGNQVHIYLKVPDFEVKYVWEEIEAPKNIIGLPVSPVNTNINNIAVFEPNVIRGVAQTTERDLIFGDIDDSDFEPLPSLTPPFNLREEQVDFTGLNIMQAQNRLTIEVPWKQKGDGYIYTVTYGNSGNQFRAKVVVFQSIKWYKSRLEGSIDASQYTRVYPLSPSLSRDNTPESIQNFETPQARFVLQESEYTISFTFVVKEDNLHYAILEDLVNKPHLNTKYDLLMIWNWFDGGKTLKPKFTFEDRVTIIDGVNYFGIGEEQAFSVTFKKHLEGISVPFIPGSQDIFFTEIAYITSSIDSAINQGEYMEVIFDAVAELTPNMYMLALDETDKSFGQDITVTPLVDVETTRLGYQIETFTQDITVNPSASMFISSSGILYFLEDITVLAETNVNITGQGDAVFNQDIDVVSSVNVSFTEKGILYFTEDIVALAETNLAISGQGDTLFTEDIDVTSSILINLNNVLFPTRLFVQDIIATASTSTTLTSDEYITNVFDEDLEVMVSIDALVDTKEIRYFDEGIEVTVDTNLELIENEFITLEFTEDITVNPSSAFGGIKCRAVFSCEFVTTDTFVSPQDFTDESAICEEGATRIVCEPIEVAPGLFSEYLCEVNSADVTYDKEDCEGFGD